MLLSALACVCAAAALAVADLGPRDKISQQIVDNQGPYEMLPPTKFYMPDLRCSGYLEDSLLMCPEESGGLSPATWLNVTVEDYHGFTMTVVHRGARTASMYRAAPCRGRALVRVTRFCASAPAAVAARALPDGFDLPEAAQLDPLLRIAAAAGDEQDERVFRFT